MGAKSQNGCRNRGVNAISIAVTRYILWNEGTADKTGTVLNKAIVGIIM